MRPVRALKRLARMVFRRNTFRLFRAPRSRFDFHAEVGDGTGSSTVMAPLFWIARTFPEAPPMLWRQRDDGQEERERGHDLLRLLQRPNQHYTGPILWMATLVDYHVDGNAYWFKIRDGAGRVRELWWAPHWLVEPKSESDDVFIEFYEYSLGAQKIHVSPDDVVHFRFGLDGDDPRKGRSPLKSVLREVFTDDEAANFTAQLLRNMGVPGLLVSPETGGSPSDEDVQETKEYLRNMTTGDRRGEPLVMSGPTKIQQFGFSPEQLLLRELRRIPEERVTAVLGVPAIVAGLGAGLDRSTFTNMGEAREAAYESGIIPTQRLLAEDVRFQLLTDFEPDVYPWRFGFDLADVRVLQEDEDKITRRYDVGVRGGWVRVSEARRKHGLPVDELDEVYLRQVNVAAVPVDGSAPTVLAGKRSQNGAAGDDPNARQRAASLIENLEGSPS